MPNKFNENSAIRCITKNSDCKIKSIISMTGVEIGTAIQVKNGTAGLKVLSAIDYLNNYHGAYIVSIVNRSN